jgi:sugar-specific transcriptional regulator TrmB
MLASTKVLDALKRIGLNLYERKLWVALLSRGTSTAGELSAIAKVPRSRAYDVLQSLAEKGFVVVQTAKPIKYVAIDPEEALERAKKRQEEDFRDSQKRIDRLKKSPVMKELNQIFNKGLELILPEEITGALKGKGIITQQVNSMFRGAKKKINIVTTPEGLNEIFETHFDILKKANEKGVEIKIATQAGNKNVEAIEVLGGIAEIRHMDKKEVPLTGRFAIVDSKELVFSLTDKVHATQDLALWSKSEHAAGSVLEPMFKLVWKNSKPVG